MSNTTPSLLNGFCVLSILLKLSMAQECYYPDGVTVAIDDVPCNASATVSACCSGGDLCMDNGLCLLNGIMSRGSCTDKSWGPACPRWCESQGYNGGTSLFPCSEFGGLFSCDWGNCTNTFSVPGGGGIVLRENQVAPLGILVAVEVGPAVVLHANSSTMSLISASSTTNSTTTCSYTSPQSTSGSVDDKKFTVGDMAAVGAGIGVPLTLALAVTLIMLLVQRRSYAKANLDASLPSAMQERPGPSSSSQLYRVPTLRHPMTEYQASTYQELPPAPAVNEMEAFTERYELNGK